MDISTLDQKIRYSGPYVNGITTACLDKMVAHARTKTEAREELFRLILRAADAINRERLTKC